jgi:hypothetical protein
MAVTDVIQRKRHVKLCTVTALPSTLGFKSLIKRLLGFGGLLRIRNEKRGLRWLTPDHQQTEPYTAR